MKPAPSGTPNGYDPPANEIVVPSRYSIAAGRIPEPMIRSIAATPSRGPG